MGDHAILSPSAADRWMACPGQPFFCKDAESPSSAYAVEGTKAHSLLEWKLKKALLNASQRRPENDAEMDNHTSSCVEYIQNLIGDGTVSCFGIEERVAIPQIPDGFGTVDFFMQIGDEVHVIDFKYGAGVFVSAHNNTQMKVYALGILEIVSKFPKVITLHIMQPRMDNFDSWSIETEALRRWGSSVLSPAARLAYKIYEGRTPFFDSHLRPTEKGCYWCVGRAPSLARPDGCPAFRAKVNRALSNDFAQADLADRMAEALDMLPLVKQWCVAIDAKAHEMLSSNRFAIKGYCLEPGRSTRKWTNEEDAVAFLAGQGISDELLYKRSVLSPAQAEKLLKRDQRGAMEMFIERVSGSMRVAKGEKSLSDVLSDSVTTKKEN